MYAFKTEIDQWWASDHHRKKRESGGSFASDSPEVVRPSHRTSYLRPAIYVFLIAVIIAASPEMSRILVRPSRPHLDPNQGQATLVILSFANHSKGGVGNRFAQELGESLTHKIGNGRGLRIITVSSEIPYLAAGETLHEIPSTLHPQALIRGSVQFVGGKSSVSVELVEGANGSRLWAHQYQQSGPDLSSCEKALIPRITAELEPAIMSVLGGRVAGSVSFPSGQTSQPHQ
ncbi:MAG TPA: hypothetical protein VGR81_07025 [Candidatus Acidoferrales bacterium]|nr:hypothetical protein [Candidatus Acidoferrales bacterium]